MLSTYRLGTEGKEVLRGTVEGYLSSIDEGRVAKEHDFLHSLLDLVLSWNFLALSCPTKDTSCIASDGHSNVLTTTAEAENVQECGSKYDLVL